MSTKKSLYTEPVLSTLTMEEIREYDETRAPRDEIVLYGDQVVYILEFDNGIIKIGQSTICASRFAGLLNDPRVRDAKLVEYWLQRSARGLEDERMILTLAHELGATVHSGREWFTGIDPHLLRIAAEVKLLGKNAPSRALPERLTLEEAMEPLTRMLNELLLKNDEKEQQVSA